MNALIDWSEFWAPLIAFLFIYLFAKTNYRPLSSKILIGYLLIAICLNLMADFSWKFNKSLPEAFRVNHIYYNIHSIVRTILFSLYFYIHPYFRPKKLLPLLLSLYTLLGLSFFIFFKSILKFSSPLFTVEAIALLILCSRYFLTYLKDNDEKRKIDNKGYIWVVSGLIFYEAINFFIFLSFTMLMSEEGRFANELWYIHNVSYVIFCACLTKAIYESRRK